MLVLVQPVTSGLRVTITYIINCTPDAKLTGGPISLAASSPFAQALQAALLTPEWMPEGRELGFSLGHLYPRHTSAAFSPALLKGADAALVASARQLHLDVKIVPVWSPGENDCDARDADDTPEQCGCSKCRAGQAGRISRLQAVGDKLVPLQVVSFEGEWEGDRNPFTKLPEELQDTVRSPDDIYWVRADFKEQQNLLGLGWGNEAYVDCMLSAAAAIVTVPPARRRQCS